MDQNWRHNVFMGMSLPPRAMKQWVEDSMCTYLTLEEREIAKDLPPRFFRYDRKDYERERERERERFLKF
jgi:hypothetical protein